MFETRITKLFGIKYPIIGGCMQGLSRAEFVAAISNAGALGIIASAIFLRKEELRDEIRKMKDLTDQPFAVNVNLFPTVRPISVEEYIDVVIEEGVPILETSGRSPKAHMERIKQGGVKFMHKCARVRDAVSIERLGADAVSIVGFECGGHPAMDDVTSLILVPLAVDSVSIPVIAGGGFVDGRGLVAALALGAEAVVMGTRFMATKECPAHDNVKEWMLKASETDTTIIQRSIQSNSRVMKNAAALKVLEMEGRGASLEDLLTIIGGEHGREVIQKGEIDAGTLACGEAVGLIRDIPTVREMVQSVMRQAGEVRGRVDGIAEAIG